MDIATRLKEFLDHSGLQSTQFADACGIPRPSFSQLLRGRNRKVSDEVIAKIHDSFPQLSVLWLMFGEGEMVTNANIKISEPQNSANPPLHFTEQPDSEPTIFDADEKSAARNLQQSTSMPSLPGMNSDDFASPLPVEPPTYEAMTSTSEPSRRATPMQEPKRTAAPAAPTAPTALPPSDEPKRRVVSIMVFYNDRSFETFLPEAAT